MMDRQSVLADYAAGSIDGAEMRRRFAVLRGDKEYLATQPANTTYPLASDFQLQSGHASALASPAPVVSPSPMPPAPAPPTKTRDDVVSSFHRGEIDGVEMRRQFAVLRGDTEYLASRPGSGTFQPQGMSDAMLQANQPNHSAPVETRNYPGATVLQPVARAVVSKVPLMGIRAVEALDPRVTPSDLADPNRDDAYTRGRKRFEDFGKVIKPSQGEIDNPVVSQVAEGVVTSASIPVMLALAGLPAAYAAIPTVGAFALNAYADALQRNKQQGMADGKARAEAGIEGASEAAWEYVSNMAMLGPLGRGVSKGAAKVIKEGADAVRSGRLDKMAFKQMLKGNLGRDFLKSMAVETGTEPANTTVQYGAGKAFGVTGQAPLGEQLKQTAEVAGGQAGVYGAIAAALGVHGAGRLRQTLADSSIDPKQRAAAVTQVAQELSGQGMENEAAILHRSWMQAVQDGKPINLESAGISVNDPRGEIHSPAALATRSEEVKANDAARLAATPGKIKGAPDVASLATADLVSFLQQHAPVSDKTQLALVPKSKLLPHQVQAQEEDAKAGLTTVFYTGQDGEALAAISGGPKVAFVPANLGPEETAFKARHEKGHALDAREDLDPLTDVTRARIAQAVPSVDYATHAQDLEIRRAKAGMGKATAAEEFDELAQDVRANGPYAARDADPVKFKAKLGAWVTATAAKDPGAFQRFKDRLRQAAAGLPGIRLPDERRGTTEQWAAVADAAMAELTAAERSHQKTQTAAQVKDAVAAVAPAPATAQAPAVDSQASPPPTPAPEVLTQQRPAQDAAGKPDERQETEDRAIELGINNPGILTDFELNEAIVGAMKAKEAPQQRQPQPIMRRVKQPDGSYRTETGSPVKNEGAIPNAEVQGEGQEVAPPAGEHAPPPGWEADPSGKRVFRRVVEQSSPAPRPFSPEPLGPAMSRVKLPDGTYGTVRKPEPTTAPEPAAPSEPQPTHDFEPGDAFAKTERTLNNGNMFSVVDHASADGSFPEGGVIVQQHKNFQPVGPARHMTLEEAGKLQHFTQDDLIDLSQAAEQKQFTKTDEVRSVIGEVKRLGGIRIGQDTSRDHRPGALKDLNAPPGVFVHNPKASYADARAEEMGYPDGGALIAAIRDELETGRPQFYDGVKGEAAYSVPETIRQAAFSLARTLGDKVVIPTDSYVQFTPLRVRGSVTDVVRRCREIFDSWPDRVSGVDKAEVLLKIPQRDSRSGVDRYPEVKDQIDKRILHTISDTAGEIDHKKLEFFHMIPQTISGASYILDNSSYQGAPAGSRVYVRRYVLDKVHFVVVSPGQGTVDNAAVGMGMITSFASQHGHAKYGDRGKMEIVFDREQSRKQEKEDRAMTRSHGPANPSTAADQHPQETPRQRANGNISSPPPESQAGPAAPKSLPGHNEQQQRLFGGNQVSLFDSQTKTPKSVSEPVAPSPKTSSHVRIEERTDDRGTYHSVKVSGSLYATVRDPVKLEALRRITTEDSSRAIVEANRILSGDRAAADVPTTAAETNVPAVLKKYGAGLSARPYEVLEQDYVDHRKAKEIERYQRGIDGLKEELDRIHVSRSTQRSQIEAKINPWSTYLNMLKQGTNLSAESAWRREYFDLVKKAISKGESVPAEVIAQRPEFTKAIDARARYDKGRHTSFANKSIAVDQSTVAEHGFKVKRQDGKPITTAQTQELVTGMREIGAVVGDLTEIVRAIDPTVAHTNGKHPFMRGDAGGMYSSSERTVSVGMRDGLGQPIRAMAHEVGHMLDIEAGSAKRVSVPLRGPSSGSVRGILSGSGKRRSTSSLAEVDGSGDSLIREATARINDQLEVRHLVKAELGKQETPEARAEVERAKIQLGTYWREPREVFARLFEQYVATKHGAATVAADSPGVYQTAPGWWSKADFEYLQPKVEMAINERLQILRAARRSSPTAKLSLASSFSPAWRERGLNAARAIEYAAKYLPAGGKPSEDIIGVIPKGKEYLQRVERAWWEAHRKNALWSRALTFANRDLKKADRAYIRDSFMRDYEAGGVSQKWPSPAVAKFAQAWQSANETISQEAGGIIKTFRGRDSATYVPHRLTDEGRKALEKKSGDEWDALKAAAKVNGIDVHVLAGLHQDPLRQGKYGSIDYARIANLPWEVTTPDGRVVKILETDPATLFAHVRNAARRLSTVKEFGSDNASAEYLDQVAANLVGSGTLDSDQTKDALSRIWKRLEGQDAAGGQELNRMTHGLWQALDSVVATLNLSGAVIGNLIGGHLPESVRMGWRPTMKAFYDAYTTSLKNPDLDELHALVDLEGDLLHDLQATETLEGKVAKGAGKVLAATGFVAANRRINLAVARAMQRQNLNLMVAAVRSGKSGQPGSKWAKLWGRDAGAAERYLTEELKFSDEDLARMVVDGPSDQDMSRAIGKEMELVNAMNESPGSRPKFIAHPLWRLAFAYSTYVRKMYDTTKFAAREARAGNMRPLTTLLVAGTVTAEAMRWVKDFLKDRENEDEGWLDRLLSDMMETGVFGLGGSFNYAVKRSSDPNADFFSDAFKPPHFETINAITSGLVGSVREVSIKPLWKKTARVASAVDIIDKQVTKLGGLGDDYRQRDAADRLVNKVYLRDSTAKDGTERAALDPIPSKHKTNTTRRLIERLRQSHDDAEILEMIRAAKSQREGE